MKFPIHSLQELLGEKKLVIVTGHYGSGKTEFAVNLTFCAAQCQQKLALADLDIMNPYFRSRERQKQLEERGVRLIATSQQCINADVPALPPDVFAAFQDADLFSVLDVGGDPTGARVLARFAAQIRNLPHALLLILNANRPETSTAEKAMDYLRAIEQSSGLAATHIVNNTHLCGETTVEEILKGAKLATELTALSNLPVLCHVAHRKLCEKKSLEGLSLFPIDIYMKKPWE